MVADRRSDRCLLIADDDAAFRQTVVEILEPYFRTIAVPTGEHAIRVFEDRSVDLALFDMHMPLLTGLEAIRWIREHELQLPCILMSSEVTEELESRALELETFSVLRKPPRRSQLLDTIHGALEL